MTESTQVASIEDFFSSCPDMLFIAALDGRLLLVSEALRANLNPGADLGALVYPEDRAGFEAAWARLRDGGEPAQIEARFHHGNGELSALVCHAARSGSGEAIHGSLRPAAGGGGPEGPRLKERMLDAIVAHVPVNMWAIDDQGIFLYQDGNRVADIGLRSGQFVGMNMFTLYAEHQSVMTNIRRALAGESLHSFELAHDVQWESWIVPLREGDRTTMVFGFSMDITKAWRTEEELRVRLVQLEQQQHVIQSLSTPIIEVWDGVLTLPMLGVLDSVRTAEVMDNLLARVASSRARFAILDLTGVEVVDTQVASHLLELVSAIGLLGAEGIVTGIMPSVAQTMVSLGLDLTQINTQRNLRAALSHCIRKMAAQRAGA